MRSDDALLLDILIAGRKIMRFTAGMTIEAFETDEIAQSAVIRELQVIGEAARLVSDETKATYLGIDWRTMVGMRNRLVHEYFAIRLDVVWQTILDDISPLVDQLSAVFARKEDATSGGE